MKNILIPLLPEYTIQIPHETLSLLAWLIWLAALIFIAIKMRERESVLDRQKLIWMAILSVLILIFTPFFGVNPGSEGSISASYAPFSHLMFFAAVPWMVAGGMIGLLPAMGLAGISGLLLSYLDTHNIFTPLILMSLSLVYSWGIRQRYQTLFYRLLRFPVFGGLISLLICSGLVFIASILSVPSDWVSKIVVSVTRMPKMMFSLAGMVFVGGVVATFIGILFEKFWGRDGPLEAAPGEKSLIFRILSITIPLFALLWTGLAIGFWMVSEKATRQAFVSQLINTSDTAAYGISTFVDTGELILLEIASDPQLVSASVSDSTMLLAQKVTANSFFDQIGLMDNRGALLTTYSMVNLDLLDAAPTEEVVSNLITQNELSSVVILPAYGDNQKINLNFLIGIKNAAGQITRVLWGQTTMDGNSNNRGWINALNAHEQDGVTGQIIGESGVILYHTDPDHSLNPYQGTFYSTPTYFEGNIQTGKLELHYFQPILDTGWAVMVSIPKLVIQEMTWQTTYPVLIVVTSSMLLILTIVIAALWPLIQDIRQLNLVTWQVSKGDFDGQLSGSRARAEMGQMLGVVGRMFGSLRKGLSDKEKLLDLRKSLDNPMSVTDTIQTILEAAMTQNVSSVRVVLQEPSGLSPDVKIDKQFGLGAYAQDLARFDGNIINKLQSNETIFLTNSQVDRNFELGKQISPPTAVIAHQMKREDETFGALWVTHHDGKYPEQAELSFFEQLAKIASGAIINAQNQEDYRIHQAQLKAILDTVPDAILITDSAGQVVYHNQRVRAMLDRPIANKNLKDLLVDENLVEILEWGRKGFHSKEIQTNEGKYYQVITEPIDLNAKEKGQVTLITELTDQRVRETRKSEFVTTVSHELRSPLTLIHGYAKILRLTGDLTEQQDGYVNRIIKSVEEMTSLVQNLLDMGRLESGTSIFVSQVTAQELGQKIMQSMDLQAKQKNISLQTSFPETPIVFHADVTLLTQALKNLVDNAIKFTKMGGGVTLSTETDQGNVIFSVRDTGMGIAPLDQRHIFEKFKTMSADPGSDKKGSGLGLAIVKSIAERHQGRVWFETQLGKGSTFYLQIPIK